MSLICQIKMAPVREIITPARANLWLNLIAGKNVSNMISVKLNKINTFSVMMYSAAVF